MKSSPLPSLSHHDQLSFYLKTVEIKKIHYFKSQPQKLKENTESF